MTEPTDDEILEAVKHLGAAMLSPVEVARAVLAKWGTPAPSGDAEDAQRWRFAEANITYADFRRGGYVNTIGFPEDESKEAVREAIDAARKEGNKP